MRGLRACYSFPTLNNSITLCLLQQGDINKTDCLTLRPVPLSLSNNRVNKVNSNVTISGKVSHVKKYICYSRFLNVIVAITYKGFKKSDVY